MQLASQIDPRLLMHSEAPAGRMVESPPSRKPFKELSRGLTNQRKSVHMVVSQTTVSREDL